MVAEICLWFGFVIALFSSVVLVVCWMCLVLAWFWFWFLITVFLASLVLLLCLMFFVYLEFGDWIFKLYGFTLDVGSAFDWWIVFECVSCCAAVWTDCVFLFWFCYLFGYLLVGFFWWLVLMVGGCFDWLPSFIAWF